MIEFALLLYLLISQSCLAVGSYGLFRSMTGVGGRPEVVLEGAAKLDGPWTEIPFKYKPGAVDRPAPFVGIIFDSLLSKEHFPLIAFCFSFSAPSTSTRLANVCDLSILPRKASSKNNVNK